MRHKFNAKPVVFDGIRFDSTKEGNYYNELKMRLKGDVLFFLRQVPFDLPGSVKYRCDFEVFYKDGRVEFIDVKGKRTQMYITKKKMVESLYPVKIIEK